MRRNERSDPRSQRTRANLQAALLQLLRQKTLAQIKIKELTAEANVSRQAFYLHFDSKEELLFSHVDDLFAQIHKAIFIDKTNVQNLQQEMPLVIAYRQWANAAEAMEWVMQFENKDLLIARLRAYIALLMDELAEHPQTEARKSPLHEHIVDFVAGGFYMLVKRWMAAGMQQSPEEMGRVTYQLMTTLSAEIG